MRITIKELDRHMMNVLNNRYSDLANLQEQMSTGKRLQRPSDDPVDVANDLKLTTHAKELQQYKSNINDGLAFMQVTDTAMQSMNTLMQRMRELAVQGSSDTLSATERTFIGKEADQLFRQLVTLVDTQYKGDYVFSGTQTKIAPLIVNNSSANSAMDYTNLKMAYFNAGGMAVGSTVQLNNGFDNSPIKNVIPGSFSLSVAGTDYVENKDYKVDYVNGTITILSPALALDVTPGTANYNVNQVSLNFDYLEKGKDIYGSTVSNLGSIQREIETGVSMPVNITSDELTSDVKTGIDMTGTMIRLGQSLIQNDQPGVETAIDEIDVVFKTVLAAQSKNGARINRFETTLDRNGNQSTQTESLQSNLEDAEMADTISKFMLTQTVYNAALNSASKIIQPSLVNFL
jgi:flagellar hook-associated protein 3 FlgL